MIVAYFIIFNMILAVIFDVYIKKTDELISSKDKEEESRKVK